MSDAQEKLKSGNKKSLSMREKIDVWFEIMIGDGSRHEGKHRCVVWNYDTLYLRLIYIIPYFREIV